MSVTAELNEAASQKALQAQLDRIARRLRVNVTGNLTGLNNRNAGGGGGSAPPNTPAQTQAMRKYVAEINNAYHAYRIGEKGIEAYNNQLRKLLSYQKNFAQLSASQQEMLNREHANSIAAIARHQDEVDNKRRIDEIAKQQRIDLAVKESEAILKAHSDRVKKEDTLADTALAHETKNQETRVRKIQEAEMKIRKIQEVTPDIWKNANVQSAASNLMTQAAVFDPNNADSVNKTSKALKELDIQTQKASKSLANASQNGKGFFKTLSADLVKAAQWGIVMGAIYGSLRLFKQGVSYVIELDNALNEIRIVTGMTQEQVEGLAASYGELAEAMSVSTAEITKEAAELYRQGLAGQEVEERMKAIIMYAKISGITIAESDKIITASMNATGRSAMDVINVFSLLGDATAAGADEIGEALQKVAATADNTGVSLEQASAMIATISSVTRESAQNIGNSLKSLMSRYTMIKSKGFNDEDATKLNDVTKALTRIGIQAVDTQGQLRPFTEVLDDLGAKWETLTKNEQAYISTAMAGKHKCPTYRKL